MGTLEIQGLTKRFGPATVLNNVNLTVVDGEFFVLLGPSGGGKSTLLRLVCGIESTDAGRITLAGRDITHLPPRERYIGMVFQDYGLYPHMSARENIAYGLEARSMPRDQITQRVTEAAAKLGLTPLLDRTVVDLSGGEQQRVALARALAKDAELYLFDEPISNLDPKLRVQARRDILMVHRAKHKPTLYVTHDQNEALAIADRLAIIAHGQLQQIGTPDELIQHPANLFVASFLGAPPMNLLPGVVSFDAARGAYRVTLFDQTAVRLPARWTPTLQNYRKDRITLGVPPTSIALGDAAQPGGNLVASVIEDFEPLVSEVIVTLKLAENTLISGVFQGVDEDQFEIGKHLPLSLDGEQFCLFDPDTEQALQGAA